MKNHKQNLPPGTVIYTGTKSTKELILEVFDYNIDHLENRRLQSIEESFTFEMEDHVTWINLNGLNHTAEIENLCKHFQIHPLTQEDLVSVRQRPKVEDFDDYMMVVVKMLYFDADHELTTEHLSFILGKDYLLTFQESSGDVFNPVRDRLIHSKGRVRQKGPDYLMYVLMDLIIDNYFTIIEDIGERIEKLEDQLFDSAPGDDIAESILDLKKEILRIRKAIYPVREVVNKLDKSESKLIDRKTGIYLQDLYDHIIQITESVDMHRELIWGLMDMHMTTISNKMNEVMKVLTIIATIFIPLTFIAGIYGMNFDNIPELHYKYSYFILWAVMIVLFGIMIYFFKRKKWL